MTAAFGGWAVSSGRLLRQFVQPVHLGTVSEHAHEMPVSQARDHLADVVNAAAYGGTVTYVTRRGRRLAAIVPAHHTTVDEARAREATIAETCRRLWYGVAGADPATKSAVRAVIDQMLQDAEDAADVAAADAALAEVRAGAPTIPAEEVWAELGIEGEPDDQR